MSTSPVSQLNGKYHRTAGDGVFYFGDEWEKGAGNKSVVYRKNDQREGEGKGVKKEVKRKKKVGI